MIPSTIEDLTGRKIGLLSVLEYGGEDLGPDGLRRAKWICQCVCSREIVLSHKRLVTNSVEHCGCGGKVEVLPKWLINKGKRGTLQWAKRSLASLRSASRKNGYTEPDITPERLVELYRYHNHHCDICGRPETQFVNGLCLDHCHTTGRIRGYLCAKHNALLTSVLDKTTSLEKFSAYLKNCLISEPNQASYSSQSP